MGVFDAQVRLSAETCRRVMGPLRWFDWHAVILSWLLIVVAWMFCYCRAYLSSNDVSEILAGQRQALAGIDVLRKICNHPDLLQRTQAQGSITYGEPSR